MDNDTVNMAFLNLVEDLPCDSVGEGGPGQFDYYADATGYETMTCRARLCCGEGLPRRLETFGPLTVIVEGRRLTFFAARECRSCGAEFRSEDFLEGECGPCVAFGREAAREASGRGSRTPPSEV